MMGEPRDNTFVLVTLPEGAIGASSVGIGLEIDPDTPNDVQISNAFSSMNVEIDFEHFPGEGNFVSSVANYRSNDLWHWWITDSMGNDLSSGIDGIDLSSARILHIFPRETVRPGGYDDE